MHFFLTFSQKYLLFLCIWWLWAIPWEVLIIMQPSFLGYGISKICSECSLLISFFKIPIFFFFYIFCDHLYNSTTASRYTVSSIVFLEQTHIVNVLLLLVGKTRLNFQNCQISLIKYDYRIRSEKDLLHGWNFLNLQSVI